MVKGRFILQDLHSRQYLMENEKWGEDCLQAMPFEHAYMALRKAVQYPERDCQVVWCFDRPDLNIYFCLRAGKDTIPCGKCPLLPQLEPTRFASPHLKPKPA